MISGSCVLCVGIGSEERSAVARALGRSGFAVEVLSSPDAESALSRLDETDEEIDCVVSAYDLGETNGVELARRRPNSGRSAAPHVLFVEDGSESVAASALNAGVTGYVERETPQAVDRLADRIQQAVGRSPPAPSDTDSRFETCRAELRWERRRLEEVRRVLSHDLRSPLNVAKGYAQYLSDEQGESDGGDERHNPSREVIAAVDRVNSGLDGLNALIQQGRPVESPESVDLGAAARLAWRRSDTGRADLEMPEDDASLPRKVTADRDRLVGLLGELYENAVDHGPPEVTVRFGTLSDGFYVSDDGAGIPASERADVFRAGTSDREARNGFGLAQVSHIAAVHRWDVSVSESAKGGCRFEITGVA